MKSTILFMIMACLFGKANGQSRETNIQYVSLKDSSMVRNIIAVIEQEKKSKDAYQFFNKGMGYISIKVSDYHHRDTVLRYYITPSLIAIRENDPDIIYPPYYAFVDGHPVLIYIKSLTLIADMKYSTDSKDSLRKFIEPFLQKTKNADFFNEKGEKVFNDKNFRPDYFKFGGDKDYYLINKSY